MDRKMIMGVAAVAGIGLLLYMRKSGDQSTLAGSGSLVGLSSAAANWASSPIVINATTKPAAVADQTAASAAPAAAKKPSAPVAATQPWEMQPTINGGVLWSGSEWTQANGAPVADGYALKQITPEQRKGRTDAQIFMQYA